MTDTNGGTSAASDPTGEVVDPVTSPTARGRTSPTFVLVVTAGAIVLLLVGATLGLALSGTFDDSAPATPDSSSVDAGFARDMIVHHDQGVLMAHYAEENTTDPEISVMAYDIGNTQTDQKGQMQGWLSLWDLPEFGDGTHMGWMGSSHSGMDPGTAGSMASMASGASASAASATSSAQRPLMPGMATNSEIDRLKGLSGAESDAYFLQLMIRHHQGGAPMMQYAAERATNPVVRNFASKMAQAQGAETSIMTQMLAARGAQPLPPTG